jgi:hypothetical protein
MGSTYEVLPAVRTLNFGKLGSISIRARSRGKSKGALPSERILLLDKRVSHVSRLFLGPRDAEFLLVRLQTHAMHVIPEVSSPVEN